MLPLCSEQALSQLLIHKEEEWRALQAHHAQLQEAALQDAHNRLEEAQGKLQHLQEDFVYNLQVLEERDRELERYDAAFTQARGQEEARQAEVSELKIQVAKLKQALAREARHVEELQQQQQLRLQEYRLELERVHSDKNGEIDHQREQYENLKWKLERKLEELDGELALQRQELLLEFESEMQKREHEFRLKADNMSNVVLSHELKVKLANKELEALKEAGAQAAKSLQRAEAVNAELERRLQGQAWELQGLEAAKDARIKDLEDKLHSLQLTRRKEEETFKRKHEELDHLARERDLMLTAVKGAHMEQLQTLKSRVLELQVQCKTLEGQVHKAECTQATAAKEKDAVISKLHEDAAALKAGWDAQIAQMSKEAISKDVQVQMLQEEEAKLKAQVARFQQDIDRYKQQLSLAIEREQSLERDQVQLGLDWQRRCDAVERDQIQRSEALIQSLTEARNQVAAKLQETERVLHEQEVVLRAVALERDQAMETLQTHGLLSGQDVQIPKQHKGEISKEFPSTEIQQLQEQNTSLRNAVTQMRREMEALSSQIPPMQLGERLGANRPDCRAGGDAAPPDYALALEAEVRNLQQKFKTLEEQLEGVSEPPKMSSGTVDLHPDACISTETPGGSAQAGQVCTRLALRKLGDRVQLLTLLVMQLKNKVRQKPLVLDTIQRELSHGVDQVHLEVLELWKQVAELEEHLGAVRQEGGESSQQRQPKREGLTDGRPMDTENQGQFPTYPQPVAQPLQTLSAPYLQRKLKEATRKILSLCLEKEQLIEMGNRMRSELGHVKGKPSPQTLPPTPETQDSSEVPEVPLHDPPLGQVQPHRTAQDPKHTKKKCFSEYAGKNESHSAQTIIRGPKAGAAARPTQRQHKIPAVTCKSTHEKENRFPKPPQAQEVTEENSHHAHRSSSLASNSLQETWQLLDLGSSPSGLPSQDDSIPAQSPAGQKPCPAQNHMAHIRTESTSAQGVDAAWTALLL
ncbi:coiled-coil domain-containing protein 57 isoform X3 [Castor canadensis]|uniref:Coiled-coil domain-containing protein 57 isoform X3 n=1 Tax=Castor canadensis TaxID=51338 RepID=A0AC58K7Q1_CASCN